MTRFPKPSLSISVPAFIIVLFLVIVGVEYNYERSHLQQHIADNKVDQLLSSLFRMRYVVESALSTQDLSRIEQEVSLVATDINMMVYVLLDMSSEIHFANHVIWRESSANNVLEGYSDTIHRSTVINEVPYVDVNLDRNSVQIYYPININNRLNYSNSINVIYLEYDILSLVSAAKEQLLNRFLKIWGLGFIVLAAFCVLLFWFLIKPLRRLIRAAKGIETDTFSINFPTPSKEVSDLSDYLFQVHAKLSRSSKRLNDAEQRWLFAVEGARKGIWDWNIRRSDLFVSDRWKEILGYQAYELDNDYAVWETKLHRDDKAQVLQNLQNYIDNKTKEYESVHRLRHKDGRYIWVHDRGKSVEWDTEGRPTRLIGTITDVTGDVRTQSSSTEHKTQSGLTDLIDRQSLANELYDLQVHNRNTTQYSAFLMINLDNFKLINDALGRQLGDRLLIQIAARLAGAFSSVGTVARLGADEFVILAKSFGGDADQANKRALALASEVRQLIGRSLTLSDQTLSISARVGLVVFDGIESLEPQTLLARADRALTQAKDSRSNGCAIYYPGFDDEQTKPFDLGIELKQAMLSEQVSVAYQPVVDQAGRIHSLEAFLRWYHPLHGFISPKKFIPVAELSDSIFELEIIAIEHVCEFLNTFSNEHIEAPIISINISSRHLHQDHFVSMIVSKIQSSNVRLDNIQLEFKGDIFFVNPESTRIKLLELQRNGLRVALDGFGSNDCAPYQIKGVGFSQVKLSEHYLDGIETSTETFAVLESVVDLSHKLSLPVVGKMIENKQQLNKLTQAKCSYFQGYIISRPLSQVDCLQLIKSQLSLNVVS
ncbi:putative bifunctional diguanylate cyclase/phosphodiesterase [Shewanella maritima]|uniref:putative bifunctional diguanylate cyclase/phosphodiesterase n=1 Tax=Shewanella maritima TaxID=2520507 RepID=UPI003734CF14